MSHKSRVSSSEIRRLYWDEKYSQKMVAQQLGVSTSDIGHMMQSYQIPRRTRKEARNLAEILGRVPTKEARAACMRGDKSPNWTGGCIISGGYIRLRLSILNSEDLKLAKPMAGNLDTVLEHRLIVARRLGRSLLPQEIVHHIDGVKTHNADNNLVLSNRSMHYTEDRIMIDTLKVRVQELEARVTLLEAENELLRASEYTLK